MCVCVYVHVREWERQRERDRERREGADINQDYAVFLRNGVVNMMSNALYKMVTNQTGSVGGDDVVIATYIMSMPHKLMNISIDITTLIGGVLFPFAFSFLIPVSILITVDWDIFTSKTFLL